MELVSMLTPAGCASRRQRLWDALPGPCDLLVVADPQNLIYFAGYAQSPFEFRSADAGALLVLEPGRATLVADNVVGPFTERASVDELVAPVWYQGRRSAPHRQATRVGAVVELLARLPGARVGLELASVPAGVVEGLRASRPDLKLVDLDPVIRPLRRAKDPDELELLRRSMRAGEAGHAAALEELEPGMTELEAFLLVQNAAMEALGAQALLYGDFATGPRCETEKGGPPGRRIIAPGDLCLLDFSVVVFGYRGDFTNTFAAGAGPTPRQRQMFEFCLEAIEAGEAQLRPGTPARSVDAAVRAAFARHGVAESFTSHSGHGLGLSHPEPPYFVPESTDTLMVGDVVALEPGLYIEGSGGMRYERNYLITADGFETLSHHRLQIEPGRP